MARMGIGLVGLAVATAWPAAAWAACSVRQGDFDGNGSQDVRIVGDSLPQRIEILDNAGNYRVKVDCSDDGDFSDPGDVDTGVLAVAIQGYDVRGGGQDRITYSGDPRAGGLKSLSVAFGPVPGASFNSLLLSPGALSSGAALVVDVAGSAGYDRLEVEVPDLDTSAVTLRADLGAGNDSVDLRLDGSAVVRSSLSVDLALGSGFNYFEEECGVVLDDTAVSIHVEGGGVATQRDSLSIGGCSLTNRARLFLSGNLLGGDDIAGIGFSADAFDTLAGGEAYVRIAGGPGNDRLTAASGYSSSGSVVVDGRLDVAFDGGPGNDTLLYEPGQTLSGNGRLRVQLHGGDGADVVLGSFDVDSSATAPQLDASYNGGRGADSVFPSVLDPGGNALWGPFGAVQLEGGQDWDVCVRYGEQPLAIYQCESVY